MRSALCAHETLTCEIAACGCGSTVADRRAWQEGVDDPRGAVGIGGDGRH